MGFWSGVGNFVGGLFGAGSGAGLVGAGLNYYGAKEANKMNQDMAREQMGFQRESNQIAMNFSAEQAQKQMDFQERMSSTSYQRAMADMEAAGLNPILAFQQGGSSTPGGASAQGVSSPGAKAEYRNQYAGAVASALQAMQIAAQIQQSAALTDLMKAELPEKKATSDVYDTRVGKVLKWAEKILSPLGGAADTAGKFFKYMR